MNRVRLFLALLLLQGYFCRSEARADVVFEYQDVKPLAGKDIQELTLREKDYAAYYGLQFGPKTDDVFYLIFDCKQEYGRHDIMFVYIPDHEIYGKPILMKGSWKSGRIGFRKIQLASNFGDIDVMYDIRLSSRTLWEKRKIDLDTIITCKMTDKVTRKKCSFVLKGSFLPAMQAYAPIDVFRILQEPTLKVSWDRRSNPPRVKCRISMGKQGLFPASGLKARARLVVSTEEGEIKIKRGMRIKPSGAGAYFTYKPRKKFKQATPYKAEVTVTLAPFFGAVKDFATMVLRK